MNFKKTAVALAAGMMLSGGAMADPPPITINLSGIPLGVDASRLAITASDLDGDKVIDMTELQLGNRFTSFGDIVSGLVNPEANVTALAASLNEVTLDGSIVIDGATVSFGAIQNVTASASATSSNVEDATASARAINGNSLATTVIGSMGTVGNEENPFVNRVSDKFTTDFAAQTIEATAGVADLTGGVLNSTFTDPADPLAADITEVTGGLSALGGVGMVSASVNTGELLGNIKIVASNETPTWFLSEQAVASVSLTNLDAATTVIGAMNTTNAINEVMRDVNLKTAVQVIGATN